MRRATTTLAMAFVFLTTVDCSLIYDGSRHTRGNRWLGVCGQSFGATEGVFLHDEETSSGTGRGLFTGSGRTWTFSWVPGTLSDSGNEVRLDVTVTPTERFVIRATLADGRVTLSELPSGVPAIDLSACGDAPGLYDPASQAFSLWRAAIDNPPHEMFAYRPSGGGTRLAPVAGDWDGDGEDSVGLYDPTSQTFYLADDEDSDATDLSFRFPGALPAGLVVAVAGDWDGDDSDEVGLFSTATGEFLLLAALDGSAGVNRFRFGRAGAAEGEQWPIAGDWNGSGSDGVGVYDRVAGGFRLSNTNSDAPPAVACALPTAPDSVFPLAGDWAGSGSDGIGLYDPVTRGFRLFDATASCDLLTTFDLGPSPVPGSPPAFPLVGDWNGS